MWARGLAAVAALGLGAAGLRPAIAGEVRGSLSVNAYVAVTGSINATTTAPVAASTSQDTEATGRGGVSRAAPAATPTGVKLGSCTAVSLSCKGPRSMRIIVHADGERLKTEHEDATVEWNSETNATDLCAAGDAHADALSMCGSDQSANNVLGVTVDY